MLDMGWLEPVVSTPTDQGVASTHAVVTFGSIPLCACGAQSSVVVLIDYPRPKDNPTPPCLELETLKDSLRFQVDEDMDAANVVKNVIGLSLGDVGTWDLDLARGGKDDLPNETEIKGDVGD